MHRYAARRFAIASTLLAAGLICFVPPVSAQDKYPNRPIRLLIPMSAVLVLLILGIFGWAVHRGQFDDIEREGERILQPDSAPVDGDQGKYQGPPEQSRR